MIRSTISSTSVVTTSPLPSTEPHGPGLSSFGPRSALSRLPRRIGSVSPFAIFGRQVDGARPAPLAAAGSGRGTCGRAPGGWRRPGCSGAPARTARSGRAVARASRWRRALRHRRDPRGRRAAGGSGATGRLARAASARSLASRHRAAIRWSRRVRLASVRRSKVSRRKQASSIVRCGSLSRRSAAGLRVAIRLAKCARPASGRSGSASRSAPSSLRKPTFLICSSRLSADLPDGTAPSHSRWLVAVPSIGASKRGSQRSRSDGVAAAMLRNRTCSWGAPQTVGRLGSR